MKSLRGHIALVPLLSLLVIPPKLQANELTCPVQEVPVNAQYQWRLTDTSCPEGEGMWNKTPAIDQGVFWIQCSYTQKIPDAWFRILLATVAPADKIILRKESGRFRCLVGPYHSYRESLAIRNQMRTNDVLKQAFVRSVSNQEMANYTPVPAPAPAADVDPPSVEEIAPEMQDDIALPESLVEPQISSSMIDKSIWTREFHQVGNIYSPVPVDEDPFYEEGDKKWLRSSYDQAAAICTANGMNVVTLDSLKLNAENQATSAFLPKRLPYWVRDKVAFDIVMMVPISLTENSAIFVFCE